MGSQGIAPVLLTLGTKWDEWSTLWCVCTAYTHTPQVRPKLFCNFDPHLAFHYIGDTPNNFSLSIAVQNMPTTSDHVHNKHN